MSHPIEILETILATLKRENETENGAINDTIFIESSIPCTLFDYIELSIEELKNKQPTIYEIRDVKLKKS